MIISRFQLDASSGTVKIGPDPSQVEKLLNVPKPTTTKGVQRLLGLLTQLSKICPDYAMSCPRLRALSHKGAKFIWDKSHDQEYDQLMSNFGRLELLEPYDPYRELCALTDASYMGLAFILFQRRQDNNWSIVQVGSTTLKGSQSRWHPSELEALTIPVHQNPFYHL